MHCPQLVYTLNVTLTHKKFYDGINLDEGIIGFPCKWFVLIKVRPDCPSVEEEASPAHSHPDLKIATNHNLKLSQRKRKKKKLRKSWRYLFSSKENMALGCCLAGIRKGSCTQLWMTFLWSFSWVPVMSQTVQRVGKNSEHDKVFAFMEHEF